VPTELRVRLLGTIGVEGLTLRGKALAVLAYLAIHRQATAEVLDDSCWGEPSASRGHKRVKEVMWECRSVIGLAHLPPARAGIYTVGPDVSTDLDLFDAHVVNADALDGVERAEALRAALELVHGPIFRYPSRSAASFAWIDLENLANHWELRVEQAAIECAELFVSGRAFRDGVVVLLRLLEALPLNVALTECLMRAHAAAGELQLVESVYDAHVDGLSRVLDAAPETSTSDLREELLSGHRSRR
jgi:DNA-binding SARP family transcriptional activator